MPRNGLPAPLSHAIHSLSRSPTGPVTAATGSLQRQPVGRTIDVEEVGARTLGDAERRSQPRAVCGVVGDDGIARSLRRPRPRRRVGDSPGASRSSRSLPRRREVENPMATAPPPNARPFWNTETTVEPNANVSGSACVACWPIGSRVRSLEICRETTSQSRWTMSDVSAVTMSRPAPQPIAVARAVSVGGDAVVAPAAGDRVSPWPAEQARRHLREPEERVASRRARRGRRLAASRSGRSAPRRARDRRRRREAGEQRSRRERLRRARSMTATVARNETRGQSQ